MEACLGEGIERRERANAALLLQAEARSTAAAVGPSGRRKRWLRQGQGGVSFNQPWDENSSHSTHIVELMLIEGACLGSRG